jgi:hypothetical protein
MCQKQGKSFKATLCRTPRILQKQMETLALTDEQALPILDSSQSVFYQTVRLLMVQEN